MSEPAITNFSNPINSEQIRLEPEVKIAKIKEHIGNILEILGLDISHPSIAEVPFRMATSYVNEFFSGLDPRNFPKCTLYKNDLPEQLVLVKKISFVSFCEHHFVPMMGEAFVAYVPDEWVLGLSNVNQIVRYFSKRPQLQERLTAQIADSIASLLKTEHVGVVIRAKHFCVIARGSENATSETETHIFHGKFQNDSPLRREFFDRISC